MAGKVQINIGSLEVLKQTKTEEANTHKQHDKASRQRVTNHTRIQAWGTPESDLFYKHDVCIVRKIKAVEDLAQPGRKISEREKWALRFVE